MDQKKTQNFEAEKAYFSKRSQAEMDMWWLPPVTCPQGPTLTGVLYATFEHGVSI